jgi:SAM-dependent methyltransferase
MKLILKIFPRSVLIKLSLWLRPILKIYYKGKTFTDPIDNSSYRKFLPYGYGKFLRENALCPGTLSLERHRLLWLYLKNNTTFFNDFLNVLHVAPEQVFYKKFKLIKNWNYITTDLISPLADIKADVCNLPFENSKFDLIICNHVLEHIVDDLKAIQEIFRVLKKGGKAIIQVPLEESRLKTFEDSRVKKPKERARLFGQYDHVRIYGIDFYERLKSPGFIVKAVDVLKDYTKEEKIRYCLPYSEKIPIVLKN